MKAIFASLIIACILVLAAVGYFYYMEDSTKEESPFAFFEQADKSILDTPDIPPTAGESVQIPKLFEDLYSQQLAEVAIADGTPLEKLEEISSFEVLLNEEILKCHDITVEVERFACEFTTHPAGNHPYYQYDMAALKSLAHGDAIAAYVYSERAKPAEKHLYLIRSAMLSKKLGPLRKMRTEMLQFFYVNHAKTLRKKNFDNLEPDDYQAGIEQLDVGLVSVVALDQVVADIGFSNDLYPTLALPVTSEDFDARVAEQKTRFEDMFNSILDSPTKFAHGR